MVCSMNHKRRLKEIEKLFSLIHTQIKWKIAFALSFHKTNEQNRYSVAFQIEIYIFGANTSTHRTAICAWTPKYGWARISYSQRGQFPCVCVCLGFANSSELYDMNVDMSFIQQFGKLISASICEKTVFCSNLPQINSVECDPISTKSSLPNCFGTVLHSHTHNSVYKISNCFAISRSKRIIY